MSASFFNTLRSLERERTVGPWVWSALLLVLGWASWVAFAQVDVYVSAQRARVEVSRSANRVSAQAEGRIAMLRCELGRVVTKGEVLAELDSGVERAQLEEAKIELAMLDKRLLALRAQITAEQERRSSRSRLDELATEQASLGVEQARVTVDHHRELARIARHLDEMQLSARVDALNADAELSGSQLKLSTAALEIQRMHAAHIYEDKSVLARVAELTRALADLEAEREVKRAACSTLEAIVERRKLTAPANGRLGNIASLQIGDVVKAGDVIATVIPNDDVRVVAEFRPDEAVGRVLPGQTARVRLHGFAWTEFGMMHAKVRHIASEPREGTVRVELALDASALPRIPLQHGLPGSVDVEVDHATPWALLLRSVGGMLVRDADAELRPGSAVASGGQR